MPKGKSWLSGGGGTPGNQEVTIPYDFYLGRYEVTVKHAPRWMLALGGGQAGAAVRALAWMGPTHVRESLAALQRTLPSTEWQALTAGRAGLPSWMARAIGEAIVEQETRG